MIPKRLIFVWLGNKQPYVDYCINNFHNVNPDYEIMKVFFTEDEISESKNLEGKILKILEKNDILSTLKQCETDQRYLKTYKYNKNVIYKIILSLKIRYRMLYRYGGIYLDCDTFPIKPFDDELLKLDKFSCIQGEGNNVSMDCFFIGLNNVDWRNKKWILLPTRSGYGMIYNNLKFRRKCYKFRKCKIKYGEHYNDPSIHYIDHYWYRTRTKY